MSESRAERRRRARGVTYPPPAPPPTLKEIAEKAAKLYRRADPSKGIPS